MQRTAFLASVSLRVAITAPTLSATVSDASAAAADAGACAMNGGPKLGDLPDSSKISAFWIPFTISHPEVAVKHTLSEGNSRSRPIRALCRLSPVPTFDGFGMQGFTPSSAIRAPQLRQFAGIRHRRAAPAGSLVAEC
ncbi:MAG: hypothetical protein HOQ36_06850 [Nocardia sp.]|nr:hypothetical protein [Nocardia sp.]